MSRISEVLNVPFRTSEIRVAIQMLMEPTSTNKGLKTGDRPGPELARLPNGLPIKL